MRGLGRLLGTLGVAATLVLAAVWWAIRPDPPAPLSLPAGGLHASLDAADGELRLRLTGPDGAPLPAGLPLRLTLSSGFGPLTTTGETAGEAVALRVPWDRAGVTPWRVEIAGRIATGELQLEAGPPVTPLEVAVGARSIRAATGERAAAVVVPLDAAGNPSDVAATLTSITPDGARSDRLLERRGLLAWGWLPASRTTGTLIAVAAAGEARAERAEVDVLPGPTAAGEIRHERVEAFASGRDPWRLRLAGLRDAAGNEVVDGEAIAIAGAEVGGGRRLWYTAPAVLGEVTVALPAPDVPGAFAFEATGGAARLGPTELRAIPALPPRALPLRFADGELLVGPVVDALGALPDDGSRVRIVLLDAAGRPLLELTRPLVDGALRWPLPPLPDGAAALRASFGGVDAALPLPRPPIPIGTPAGDDGAGP